MPAVSKAQRQAMAIAEHHPDKVYKHNKGLLKMSKEQLRHFSSTSEKNLPDKVSNKVSKKAAAKCKGCKECKKG